MNESIEPYIVPSALQTHPMGAVGASEHVPLTAAQAKVDAVANLTMKAYEKAATLQITPEESARLQADFPDEAFKPGAAGKDHLLYLEHPFLRDRFIEVFGMGGWAMVPRNRWAEPFKTQKGVEGSRIYVEAMLVIRGCFVAEAVGEMEYYPSNGSQNYGDAVEGAETAAFRRCAKKFGVGLQAWKKDWCEGWWKRKNYRPPQGVQVQRPEPSKPVVNETVTTAAKPFPTAATLAWMLKELKARPLDPARKLVSEYFEKAGAILPTEELEDLPLRFVPNTPKLLRDVGLAIAAFEQGEEAGLAFKPHDEPESTIKTSQKAQNIQAAEPNGQQALTHPDPEIMGMIVTVPRKGQKKADYMKNPDTIGSLYENRHNSEEDRRRLFGFARWEPSGWTKDNGQVMPPSDSDLKFKAAHTKFMEWFKANHADEGNKEAA